MVLLLALVIFAGLSAATGYVSVVCYHATYGDAPDVTADANCSTIACAIAATTLTCFIPFRSATWRG